MMKTINPRTNGITITAPKGSTIPEAARSAYAEIPTLCFLKGINEIGACHICIVELKNGKLVTSCVCPAREGMEVYTNTPKVLDSRKKTLQLLLPNHNRFCLPRVHSGHCELQELAHELGMDGEGYYDGEITPPEIDISAVRMIRDNSKCILCRRCMAICENMQGIGVTGANNRGFSTSIGLAFEMGLGETSCVSCGQYIVVCSIGALTEKDYTADVFVAIADPKKHVIAQTAPAVRAGLGEEFGLPIGTDVEDKMAAALRCLGSDEVLDTNFPADFTVMEEAHEFIDRAQNGGVLPLITPCSPGRVKYCEHYFSDMIENLSPCKSPQQVFGAIAKSHYAEKAGIDPEDIVSVSVMPYTAKKFEIGREDEDANGMSDANTSITTRELVHTIKKAGIQFLDLPDGESDASPGLGTDAAVILDATGGVTEVALGTVVETLAGEELSEPDSIEVCGTKGIKEVTYNVAGMEVKIAVAFGLDNARELLNKMKPGEASYHFIEITGCLSDCVNSGGQPQQPGHVHNTTDIHSLRVEVLYDIDAANPIRKSRENPAIKELYAAYLGGSGSEKAHHLLHTIYVKRSINQY